MVFPRVGEDRDATQGRVTIQEAARRLGVKEDAVRKRIQRGVPATHARRTRPKTINGAYQMQGSSGPLQMHPASQLRLYGVLRSSQHLVTHQRLPEKTILGMRTSPTQTYSELVTSAREPEAGYRAQPSRKGVGDGCA